MDTEQRFPDIYYEAFNDYKVLSDRARQHLSLNYARPGDLMTSLERMEKAVTIQLKRNDWFMFGRLNLEKEIRKSLLIFRKRIYQESEVQHRNSKYLDLFLKAHRFQFRHYRLNGTYSDLDQVLDAIISRIHPPWPGPHPVMDVWIRAKIHDAASHLPEEIVKNGGIAKILRAVAGTFLYALTDLTDETSIKDATGRIDLACRAGFYFGYLHPLVDDLLDSSDHLSITEKEEMTGALNYWIGGDFSKNVSADASPGLAEIRKALMELYGLFPDFARPMAQKLLYMLHFSQTADSAHLKSANPEWPELYTHASLKSLLSLMIADYFSGNFRTGLNEDLMLESGLIMQLTDDLRDFPDDYTHGVITPFTLYARFDFKDYPHPWLILMRALDRYIGDNEDSGTIREILLNNLMISLKDSILAKDTMVSAKLRGDLKQISLCSFNLISRISARKLRTDDPEMELFKPIDRFYRQ
ncbi:MAG TPA: hypothetical protein DC042_08485 [Bacteroidales bacterium]|nr:hypothetical protein [Bacteroidales bacterium]